MNQIAVIRVSIFRLNQAAFAGIVGVSQSTVSRWEREEASPTHAEMRRVRDYAAAQAIPWNDAWFFESPAVGRQLSRRERTVRANRRERDLTHGVGA